MKPVEEIARLERIEKALGAARSMRDWHGMESAYTELRDYALPAIAAALRAERERADTAARTVEAVRGINTANVAEINRLEAVLRAERGRAEKVEYELRRWKETEANKPDWEKLWMEQSERAEKAEVELDEARRETLTVLNRETATTLRYDERIDALETALAAALRAERERAERAEAEVRMADKISKGHVAKIDRLRRDLSREFDRTQKAESALATARNRALEEAGEALPVEAIAKRIQEALARHFPDDCQCECDGAGPASYQAAREIHAAILALRTKEGE